MPAASLLSPRTWSRLLPPSPLARRLSLQSVLYAVGEGTFMTGSAVYFTHVVGLSAAQVGLGLTIAAAAAFLVAVPMGRLADRVGAKRIWALGALVEAAGFFAYPLVHSFVAFAALVTVVEVIDAGGSAGRGAYTIDVFTREERVRSMAFMRSALNIGFTLGALAGGIALATGSDTVIRAVPLVTGVLLLVNAALVARLPPVSSAAQAGDVQPSDLEPAEPTPAALGNRGFLALSVCSGVLHTNQVLLNLVIPLWLVQETDAPHTLLAWLFGTNTVMAVVLQVPAARGSETVQGALRATRLAACSFVVCCLLVMSTADTLSWVTILLIWLGHVTVTGAELWQSAASWGFVSELSDPTRRGEYQGLERFGEGIGYVGAPALYTWLAIDHGTIGWLSIAALVVVAAACAHPAAHAAERYLSSENAAATG